MVLGMGDASATKAMDDMATATATKALVKCMAKASCGRERGREIVGKARVRRKRQRREDVETHRDFIVFFFFFCLCIVRASVEKILWRNMSMTE